MYSAEKIKEEHDLPDASVKALGQPETILGHRVASFFGIDTDAWFVITACETEIGVTTSRHEMSEVIEAGEGRFGEGIIALMHRHAEDPLLAAHFSD